MSTINIRASSFGSLFDCSLRWQGEHLLGMHRPSSLRAHLGTSIHASTAAFDQATIDGLPISADDAAEVFVRALWEPKEDVDLKDAKLSMKQAELIGLTLHARYCAEIAPTMKYASVEMPLLPLAIDCGDGLTIRLTGTLDRARQVKTAVGKVIADVKTGGRLISDGVVSIKGRAAQLGTYQLLSEHTDGEATAGSQIIALQTTSTTQVGVSHVFDAKKHLTGDGENKGLIEMAAVMFKTGTFHPNPQSALCSERFCARWNSCIYHE